MGLSTATTAVSEAIQLCVFDSRRGQQEGQELDKILFSIQLIYPLQNNCILLASVKGLSHLQGQYHSLFFREKENRYPIMQKHLKRKYKKEE